MNFLRGEIKGGVLEALLTGMQSAAVTAGMTSTAFRLPGDFLSEVRKNLISKEKVRRWPGVVIPESGRPVRLYRFRYDSTFINSLLARCDDLYAFQEYGMPDNLHLITTQNRILLGSVTLDETAWTDLTATEWSELVQKNPILSSLRLENREIPAIFSTSS